ncbi:MAG: hypothetical protein RMH77_06595 [Sulfolobales archaeon]|nr:hypothetical protein [Sulfolobales archaeon]MCX8185745.1 hypothetical protein [Sulfolobales archaeon]MDW7970047.1 hypothetical protein [Sulfolobales archaeon]
MSEEEEIPVEEVSEEKSEAIEEEGEEVLKGFTIEGLEVMLSKVEEIERLIKGIQAVGEEKHVEKATKKEVIKKEGTAAKAKRSRGERKKAKQVKSE